MVDVSEQIEYKSDNSEISQYVDNICDNVSGSYCYKSNILAVWVAKVEV